jgi:thioesterase domain-containing protein
MVEHRNVIALLNGFETAAGPDRDGTGLTICPYVFDVSVWELFINLCYGNTLHILNNEPAPDPEFLSRYIIEHRITTAYLPPTILPDIADGLASSDSAIALRRMLVGVLPIRQEILQLFLNCIPGLRIINGYGPTETTICASFFSFREASSPHANTPIGRPVSNYAIYIVDDRRNLAPVGVPGELCIAGAGVARGYWNNRELTMEKFIKNPFPGNKGPDLYCTGDIAKWLPDGNIEYMGRRDEQVKIRGYRIELEEIMRVAQQSGLVRQCVVVARADASGNKGLVGYAVTEVGFDREGLVNYLRQRLPEYMVPKLWVEVASVPLTRSGKVDKNALPQVDAGEISGSAYEAPRNELESVLVEIWQELLGGRQPGIHDNFFSLGGHSLLVIPLVKRIRKLQYPFQFKDVFKYQTIAELSEYLKGLPTEVAGPRNPYVQILNDSPNTGSPLFVIPGSPGFIDSYDDLARCFGNTCRVYGVQLVGLREEDIPLYGLIETAQFAGKCIQQVQPEGPYRLIGHSLGALLAFEIVQYLENGGQTVESLVMLDASIDVYNVFRAKAGKTTDEALIESVSFFLKNYDLITEPYPAWIKEMEAGVASAAVPNKPAVIMKFLQSRLGDGANKALYLRVAYNTIIHSLMDYIPEGKVHSELLLVKSMEENWAGYDEYLGWKSHADSIQVIVSPGTHTSLIRNKNARVLARKIKECLSIC